MGCFFVRLFVLFVFPATSWINSPLCILWLPAFGLAPTPGPTSYCEVVGIKDELEPKWPHRILELWRTLYLRTKWDRVSVFTRRSEQSCLGFCHSSFLQSPSQSYYLLFFPWSPSNPLLITAALLIISLTDLKQCLKFSSQWSCYPHFLCLI